MSRTKLVMVMGLLAVMAWAGRQAQGAALTESRDTPRRAGEQVNVGVYTNTRIFAGAMVAVNSSGYAVPAATNAGLIVIGRAEATVDNRTDQPGAGDSGALTVEVRRGVFGWDNNAGVTDADIGSFAFVEDDNSVDDDDPGGGVIAGVIVDVDANYVWVDTYHVGRTAGSYTTLAASGNATVGGTLGVTGAATLTGNALANELDARTATALLIGKATATGVTIGASDANTTVVGDLIVTGGEITLGAAGYFGIANTTQLVFVAESGATTNIVDADITTQE